MIVICPKCRTEFKVDEAALAGGRARFKCAECGYVWTEGEDSTPELGPRAAISQADKGRLMRGLGIAEHGAKPKGGAINARTLAYFLIGVGFMFLAGAAFKMILTHRNSAPVPGRASVLSARENDGVDTSKLYLELAKPLTLTREGSNEYVIMTGFIYNPSQVELPVPKLVIRLENKDGRLLQEQEREIEAKSLPPLGKADFRFKVYKFSDQIVRFVVDFAEEGKI